VRLPLIYAAWIASLFVLIWLNRGGSLFVAFLASWAVLHFLAEREGRKPWRLW
jgi:hypothetical protein